MKKIYLNNFYNKALIIDEGAQTYTLTSAKTASAIKINGLGDGFKKWQRVEYMRTLLKQLKQRGFKGFIKA